MLSTQLINVSLAKTNVWVTPKRHLCHIGLYLTERSVSIVIVILLSYIVTE